MNIMIAFFSIIVSVITQCAALLVGTKFDSSEIKLSKIRELQLPDAFPDDFARKVAIAFPETTKKCATNLHKDISDSQQNS